MSAKKSKFSIEDIRESMSLLTFGCYWNDMHDPRDKRIICFDDNQTGSDSGPYLEIKFYSKHAKIRRGDFLTKKEKKMIFSYCDYDTAEKFADNLCDWIRAYFKSFKYVRILKDGSQS